MRKVGRHSFGDTDDSDEDDYLFKRFRLVTNDCEGPDCPIPRGLRRRQVKIGCCYRYRFLWMLIFFIFLLLGMLTVFIAFFAPNRIPHSRHNRMWSRYRSAEVMGPTVYPLDTQQGVPHKDPCDDDVQDGQDGKDGKDGDKKRGPDQKRLDEFPKNLPFTLPPILANRTKFPVGRIVNRYDRIDPTIWNEIVNNLLSSFGLPTVTMNPKFTPGHFYNCNYTWKHSACIDDEGKYWPNGFPFTLPAELRNLTGEPFKKFINKHSTMHLPGWEKVINSLLRKYGYRTVSLINRRPTVKYFRCGPIFLPYKCDKITREWPLNFPFTLPHILKFLISNPNKAVRELLEPYDYMNNTMWGLIANDLLQRFSLDTNTMDPAMDHVSYFKCSRVWLPHECEDALKYWPLNFPFTLPASLELLLTHLPWGSTLGKLRVVDLPIFEDVINDALIKLNMSTVTIHHRAPSDTFRLCKGQYWVPYECDLIGRSGTFPFSLPAHLQNLTDIPLMDLFRNYKSIGQDEFQSVINQILEDKGLETVNLFVRHTIITRNYHHCNYIWLEEECDKVASDWPVNFPFTLPSALANETLEPIRDLINSYSSIDIPLWEDIVNKILLEKGLDTITMDPDLPPIKYHNCDEQWLPHLCRRNKIRWPVNLHFTLPGVLRHLWIPTDMKLVHDVLEPHSIMNPTVWEKVVNTLFVRFGLSTGTIYKTSTKRSFYQCFGMWLNVPCDQTKIPTTILYWELTDSISFLQEALNIGRYIFRMDLVTPQMHQYFQRMLYYCNDDYQVEICTEDQRSFIEKYLVGEEEGVPEHLLDIFDKITSIIKRIKLTLDEYLKKEYREL